MSKDYGSVAPKERINIVYRPASGDENTSVELPLKLLAIGEYILSEDDRQLESMNPVSVDKDNFDSVMSAHNVVLNALVPDTISAKSGLEEKYLSINIKFNSIKDFTPDALVENIPELKRIVSMRDALKALKGPLGNIPAFRKRLQELVSDNQIRLLIMKELDIINSSDDREDV
ncbi:type VI secretion protein [Kosakonia radicincitans]|uniref:type VI secretion system contractile sheath small subunit n=1 Tax=Kosakonia radicincitans TaxID=283686 RepID=UPI000903A645|nr:type VI secretion system contractile sheath small subunit [Kosakonia radicincitans]APG19800.1 type VI secretion protein [Kosakonia radicincitans]